DKLFSDDHYIGKTKDKFTTFTYSALKDSKGNYWYGYFDNILRAREIGVSPDTMMIAVKDGIATLFEDRQGRVWIAGHNKFGYFNNDQFTEVRISNLNA